MSTDTKPKRDRRAPKDVDHDRVGLGTLFAWSTTGVSAAVNYIVLSFLAIYCTDTLQMPAALVGSLILVSKVLEAFTVWIAGLVVDRSPETRWGKARPYELAIIGVWVATVLLFSVPDIGLVGQAIWVLTAYIFVNAVFVTLLGANDVLYLARAFPTRRSIAKVATTSGLITTIFAVAAGIAFPIFMAQVGKSTSGWSQLVLWFAIPMTVLGLGRFLFCREKYDTEDPAAPHVTLVDVKEMLAANKFVWVVATQQLVASAILGTGVAAYYYTYVVNNVGLMGVMGLFGLLAIPSMLAFPGLMKRFPVSALISAGAAFGVASAAIMTFAGANLVLLGISGFFSGLALLPVTYLTQLLIIDNAAYNEWSGQRRLESTMGALTAFMNRLGGGVASAVVGWTLTLSGYDGALAQQPPTATLAIILCASVLPMLLYGVIFVLMWRYRSFERLLPQVHEDLAIRHAAKGIKDPYIEVLHLDAAGTAPLASSIEPLVDDQLAQGLDARDGLRKDPPN